MSREKLESFKASELQKTGAPAKPLKPKQAGDAVSEQTASLGFARIENILDNESPEAVHQRLQGILEQLAAFESAATQQKDKMAAKKARAAVERTQELLDYLFATKQSLIDAAK